MGTSRLGAGLKGPIAGEIPLTQPTDIQLCPTRLWSRVWGRWVVVKGVPFLPLRPDALGGSGSVLKGPGNLIPAPWPPLAGQGAKCVPPSENTSFGF